jgi:mannose-6-phosphate isomerase-like protein (cupin superfamily)
MEFALNIEETTRNNQNYRWVYQTSQQMQLVFMSLRVKEEIGEEVHPFTTQFIRIEQGTGLAIVGGKEYEIRASDSVFIPAGTRHNIINIGQTKLKLYTLYSPPMHKSGLIQKVKPSND